MSTAGLDAGLAGWRAHHNAMREQARQIAADRDKQASDKAAATLHTAPATVPFTDPRNVERSQHAD